MRARKYEIMYRGQFLELFTLGVLAKACNRTVQAVNKQIAAGFIPETPFRKLRKDNFPFRLYTKTQIEAVRDVVEAIGMRSIRTHQRGLMHDEIVRRWRELGVVLEDVVSVDDGAFEGGDACQSQGGASI